jgi:hypothetical protein
MQTRITETKLYTHPDMSTMITKTPQLNEAAVHATKEISEEDVKLNRLIANSLKKQQHYHRPTPLTPTASVHAAMTSTAPTASVHAAMTSAAESFMSHYTPAPSANPTSDLVVDPITGYISPHPRDFRGCLGCGSDSHQYRDCNLNRTEPTHSTFTKNFLARYPERRKYQPTPTECTALVTVPAPLPLPPLPPR